jgi:hypothetical protein
MTVGIRAATYLKLGKNYWRAQASEMKSGWASHIEPTSGTGREYSTSFGRRFNVG